MAKEGVSQGRTGKVSIPFCRRREWFCIVARTEQGQARVLPTEHAVPAQHPPLLSAMLCLARLCEMFVNQSCPVQLDIQFAWHLQSDCTSACTQSCCFATL